MRSKNPNVALKACSLVSVLCGATVASAQITLLTTESIPLVLTPNSSASAPYMDMLVDTSPSVTTWGDKGAVGLQGAQSIYPSGTSYVNEPASTVAMKFPIGSVIDSLNAQYGAGNWTISQPTITMQYTYYTNNNIFGGGAGSFETYWVANNNWAFGQGAASGNSYNDNDYVAGTDPVYATTPSALLSWAGSESDLGSTYYNWLSPTSNPLLAGATASNPNYSSWTTDKTGLNQGLLVDELSATPALVNAITSASAVGNDPDISFYLIPTTSTLGLTIFTGGGTSTPTLTFDVDTAVPEPASLAAMVVAAAGGLSRRRRRSCTDR